MMSFKLSTNFSEKVDVLDEHGEIDIDRLRRDTDSAWRREIDRLLRVSIKGTATEQEEILVEKINKAIWRRED